MKDPKQTKSKEKTNTYQYIMRHIDIYGEPLSWFIGNNKTYNTTVGGCRTFIVISCALLFLIYSIYNLFNDRNGSFIFYDITYPEIEDTTFYYYNDFEIFFFFQSSGREWMKMNNNILQVSLIQTIASDDEDEEDNERLRRINNYYNYRNNKRNIKKKR